jgi:AraC-like DNA-binding protein
MKHPQDEKRLEKWYDSDQMSLNQVQLRLPFALPLKVSNGGLFVSRGEGKHPSRIITSYELIFVCNGVLELQEEGKIFKVQAGETLLLWPGKRHWGLEPYPEDLSFYWLHFLLDSVPQGRAEAIDHMLTIPQHRRVNRPDHLTSLFRRFLDDQETPTTATPAANLLALLMLCEVIGANTSASPAESSAARLAGRAHTLIRTEFHKPLSTSKLAKRLYCNPDYLGRVFHQHYGATLTEVLNQRRLKHACKLLLDTDHTTERIALECGFNDTGYFRRIFKRDEGLTPYAFRKLYNRIHVNTE